MDNPSAKKIIILDDDPFLLGMYNTKFNHEGFTVVGFNSGEELIKKLKEGEVGDAILLDIVIPGMDGIAVLETIRKEKLVEGSKIIMLTNQGDQSDINRAKAIGVDGYIVKATSTPSEVVSQVLNIIKK